MVNHAVSKNRKFHPPLSSNLSGRMYNSETKHYIGATHAHNGASHHSSKTVGSEGSYHIPSFEKYPPRQRQ